MSANPEPQSVEPNELKSVDERAKPTVDPTHLTHSEQVVETRGGVQRQERVVTGEAGLEHREQIVRDIGAEQQTNRVRVTQLVSLFFVIVEGLIGLRVLLKLIGANADNAFASSVYNAAALFLAPFFGLIGSPSSGGMVLEVPSLIAMLVYALVGWVIVRVISQLFFPPATRSTSTWDRYDR